MGKKINKISINSFEKAMKENFSDIVVVKWYGVDIEIRPTISLVDAAEFISNIVSAAISDDGDYMPEFVDFVMRCNVLTKYANFTISDNTEKTYDLVYKTNAFDTVMEQINKRQLDAIMNSSMQKIEFEKQVALSNITRDTIDAIEAINKMQRQMEEILDGISNEDMQRFVNAVGENEIDYDELVKAFSERGNELIEDIKDDINTEETGEVNGES